ncbi:unnamed protein product [Urochloa humidicola]
MPLAYELVVLCGLGVPVTVAWRVSYLLFPCALLIVTGLAVLSFPYDDDDLPRGAGGGGGGKGFWEVVRGGVGDYRAWVLALTYGYCYGVELIMENVAADFFRRRFRLRMEAAGAAAACFGAMNAVARPAGGVASDAVARLFGMRGRLWALWAVQTAGAALCVLVGRMGAAEAPSLAATVAVMVACAAFVQAASGLTFGIVPFVSKRSLGVVSGMTASGGAVGAIVTNRLFFSGSRYTIEEAISLTGAASLVCTLPLALVHFPRHGEILTAQTDPTKPLLPVNRPVSPVYRTDFFFIPNRYCSEKKPILYSYGLVG